MRCEMETSISSIIIALVFIVIIIIIMLSYLLSDCANSTRAIFVVLLGTIAVTGIAFSCFGSELWINAALVILVIALIIDFVLCR